MVYMCPISLDRTPTRRRGGRQSGRQRQCLACAPLQIASCTRGPFARTITSHSSPVSTPFPVIKSSFSFIVSILATFYHHRHHEPSHLKPRFWQNFKDSTVDESLAKQAVHVKPDNVLCCRRIATSHLIISCGRGTLFSDNHDDNSSSEQTDCLSTGLWTGSNLLRPTQFPNYLYYLALKPRHHPERHHHYGPYPVFFTCPACETSKSTSTT